MNGKFRNKYRLTPARAQWWDYSNAGIYFITVCTYRHKCLFGDIRNVVETHGIAEAHGIVETHGRASLRSLKQPTLRVSPIGAIVLQEWHKSFEIRNELFCDAFVLMPNHLHAILRIEKTVIEPHAPGNPSTGIAFRPPKSISSFVAGFKSAATAKINVLRNTPGATVWQPRFHDHIIRNMTEYQNIAIYIQNNPAKWADDRFHMQ